MAKKMTPALAVGALLLLLMAVGPAGAAFPGTNGKISYLYGGLRDDEVRTINPDGTGMTTLTRNKEADLDAGGRRTARRSPTLARAPVASTSSS